ncbi:C-X-C chemokine receptor type 3-2 [Erpetoichthys calabaricus]|uniref:Chemokine (C-X-C motif) receptor 3, tandem duplicate 2 n=1 Tax=Erpetoichthys calabaricus TaxID=27687 RepID=A0A8C4SYW1_ERPCA|nr:C-X-C chemokine receptor type 3-2 [Erpetoichthys calabaricus]
MSHTEEYDFDADYYNSSYPDEETDAAPCLQDEAFQFNRSYTPIMYTIVFLVGLVGNILVFLVVCRYKRRSFSLTDTFLLNLTVADLLLVLTLPFNSVQSTIGWVFGNSFCKITEGIFAVNLYSCNLFLACISFDRYLAIVHVVHLSWRRCSLHTYLACAVIWVSCIIFSSVNLYYGQVIEIDGVLTCTNNYSHLNADQWRVGLQMLNVLLGFSLPLLVMLYCYIMIFRSLCNTTRRQKQKSLKVIVSIIAAFIICWAPYNIFSFIDSLVRMEAIKRECKLEKILDIGIMVTKSLGLIHCCLNPLLYAFVGVKFRKELVRLFKSLCKLEFPRRTLSMERFRNSRRKTGSSSISSDSEMSHTAYSVMF